MPNTPPHDKAETFRSFTVRVPLSLYLSMAEVANREGLFLNQKVNQLLLLGMGEHINLDDMLLRLIRKRMAEEGAPTNGNA